MEINIKAHVESAVQAFGTLGQKQAPYIVRWTVNALARDIVQGTKNAIAGRFKASPAGLRFLTNHVRIITPGSSMFQRFGTTGRDMSMRALVGVVPPEGKGQNVGWSRYRGSLLAMMEEGGATPGPRPFGGLIGFGNYAVPVRRPSDRSPIPLRMYPINLGLQARQSIEGGLTTGALRGKQKTYLVRTGSNEGMIFQRFGKARDDTMPLFNTRAQTRLPARRYFYPTAERIVATRLSAHLRGATSQAIFGRGAYRG